MTSTISWSGVAQPSMISVVRESTSRGADRFTLSRAPFGSAGTELEGRAQAGQLQLGAQAELVGEREPVERPLAPRVEKRASASKACTLPSLTSTIGWAAIQMPSPLLRRSSAARAPSAPLEIGIPSYTPTVPGDERLATRSATSAAASSASAPVPSRGAVATPAQAEQPLRALHHRGDEAPRDPVGVVGEHEGGELVAAEPPEHVAFAKRRLERLRGIDQHSVADRVTEPLVHGPQAVEVERHERDRAVVGRQPAEPVHLGAERPRREHAGERVVVGVVPRPATAARPSRARSARRRGRAASTPGRSRAPPRSCRRSSRAARRAWPSR